MGKFLRDILGTVWGRFGDADLCELAEAGPEEREEDAGDGHVVPRLRQPRVLPLHGHADGAGEVAHGDLVGLRGGTQGCPQCCPVTPPRAEPPPKTTDAPTAAWR